MGADKGKKDNKFILFGFTFKKRKKHYELYVLNPRDVNTPDETVSIGDFCLYFNGELVLKAYYHCDEGYWDEDDRNPIFSGYSPFKLCKLDDWVEEIPRMARSLKRKISAFEKNYEAQRLEEEKFELEKNFNFGKYLTTD